MGARTNKSSTSSSTGRSQYFVVNPFLNVKTINTGLVWKIAMGPNIKHDPENVTEITFTNCTNNEKRDWRNAHKSHVANIEKRLSMADSSLFVFFFRKLYFSYFETDAVMIQRSLTTKSSRVFEEKQDSFEGFRYCNTGCSNILST